MITDDLFKEPGSFELESHDSLSIIGEKIIGVLDNLDYFNVIYIFESGYGMQKIRNRRNDATESPVYLYNIRILSRTNVHNCIRFTKKRFSDLDAHRQDIENILSIIPPEEAWGDV